MAITDADLVNWFSYHAPQMTAPVIKGTAPSDEPYREFSPESCYTHIREAGLQMARIVLEYTPSSADQTAAIRKIREAVFTANAAVACGGK